MPKFKEQDERAFLKHLATEDQTDTSVVARKAFNAGLSLRDSEIRALKKKVRDLELAEEGAKEAFGHLVDEKRELEKECRRLGSLLQDAYSQIKKLTSVSHS